MADPGGATLPLELVAKPHIRRHGPVGETTLDAFLTQLEAAEQGEGPIAVEITSTGGDADTAHRIALEIGLARRALGRRLVFIGKTIVYSAAVTVMGAFPREDRFLTGDATLLIHCRKLEKTLELEGPLPASAQRVRQLLSEIDNGLRLEAEGFARLIEGSGISLEEIQRKAADNWYLPAADALDRGLIAGLL